MFLMVRYTPVIQKHYLDDFFVLINYKIYSLYIHFPKGKPSIGVQFRRKKKGWDTICKRARNRKDYSACVWEVYGREDAIVLKV